MKKLLVVRIPFNTPAERCKEIADLIRGRVNDEFTVLAFSDNVEKTEVEIVYDPHLK
jgi:hypothetical protein